jgi:hypothetical protein
MSSSPKQRDDLANDCLFAPIQPKRFLRGDAIPRPIAESARNSCHLSSALGFHDQDADTTRPR